MKNKTKLKIINWVIFVLLVSISVITVATTLSYLNEATHSFNNEAQSRLEFRWGLFHTLITVVILFFSTILIIGWKRLFPFNVPFALIIVGICYELFFLTFTIGWVGVQGMFGFVIALLVAIILIITHSFFLFFARR
ncbi:MAG: RND transporter [Heyndrickxia sp.]